MVIFPDCPHAASWSSRIREKEINVQLPTPCSIPHTQGTWDPLPGSEPKVRKDENMPSKVFMRVSYRETLGDWEYSFVV